MKKSSTWRKLPCVSFALKSFSNLRSRCFVKWFTGSQAVSLIVDAGSMNSKEHLHQLAVDIFHTTKENNIEVAVEWIPRSLKKKADYLCKIFDDWTVKDCYLHAVNSYWVHVQ